MNKQFWLICAVGVLFSFQAMAQEQDDEDDYRDVAYDLSTGKLLLEVAERAYSHHGDYWEYSHGHSRSDGHDHETDEVRNHIGDNEELSAFEAVDEIYKTAMSMQDNPNVDPKSLDVINVAIAVIDAWPDCEDTFGAVRRAVDLMPKRAAELVARVAVKKDCNCGNAGLWVEQRVEDRIRPELRHTLLEIPMACSCSQAAMYAGVSALPENLEFSEDDTDEKKQLLVDSMSEKVQEIMDRTVALQSKNDWECGCVDVNIAASMRGIEFDELQDGVYGRLAEKYSEEVADTGLVVDSFGVLGRHPQEVWGFSPIITRDNILRRQPIIYRGDSLILDPFDPSQEWVEHPIVDFTGLGVHEYTAVEEPTDLVISEYLEGRAAQPPPVANLVKHKIVLDSEVTFDLDKYEVRAEASESLSRVADVINRSQIFSEIEIVGHTCDLASDEYNQVLSERRAQSVKNFLAGAGLNVENVRTMGRGEGEPFVPNDSEENRSKNRRVEITFFTVGDMEINKTVSQADGTTRKVEFEYIRPEDVAAANAAMRAWEEAEASRQDMDDEHRNRAIELYNGTEEVVDLGQGQYFLEIYSPEKDEEVIVAPPLPRLVKNTITLDSEVTFDLDKYDIKVEADESLKAVAKVINNAKIFSEIQIVGHTCDLASDDYNQILSENRARSVKDFLEAAGLDVDHIRTEGRGEAEPRFPNDNEANRSKNRRVEITFLTQEGLEIEKTVTDGDSRKVEISWVRPEGDLGTEGADESLTTWKQRLVPVVFNEEGYIEGTNDPRRVIGLNGAIEPGETFVIAYNESDEAITDVANLVTGQLDFRPNDTILLRKVAGDLAMSCRASSFAYVNNFPAEPPIRPITITPPPPPNNDDFASPH